MRDLLLTGLCLALCLSPLAAQTPDDSVVLRRERTGPWTMIERSDFSRYENGRYQGYAYRETRASLSPAHGGGYRGSFLVLEEVLRDQMLAARPLNEIVEVHLTIAENGSLLIADDRGFPQLRGFPAFPSQAVSPGSSWTASGERALDPDNNGVITRVPLLAAYSFVGQETYKGYEVWRIRAKYASRYSNPRPLPGGFSGLQGTHDVDILIDVATGLPLMMRDRFDETFSFPDGRTLRHRGFTLTFNEFSIPLDSGGIVAALRGPGGGSGTPPSPGRPVPQGTGRPAPQEPGLPGPQDPARPGQQGSAYREPPEPGSPVAQGPDRPRLPDAIFELDGSVPGGPGGSKGPGGRISLVESERGLVLTLEDVRFKPDSDEFLADEGPRLDRIAQALRAAGTRQFLVEGHTADVGRPESELALSTRRAKRTVDELVARGLSAELFVYRGLGATRPLVANTSEENRARNRRVEITILD